jgi:hypothetical protein
MDFDQISEVHGQLPESIAPAPGFSRSVTTKGKVLTWVTHLAERTGKGYQRGRRGDEGGPAASQGARPAAWRPSWAEYEVRSPGEVL